MAMVEYPFAIVVLSTGEVNLSIVSFPEEVPAPDPPVVSPQHESILLTALILDGLHPNTFLFLKRPIIDQGSVTGWENIPSAPVLAIDQNPLSDGSNVSSITLTGGPINAGFELEYSRPLTTDLSANTGSFDGGGASEFKIQVYGLGPLLLKVFPTTVNTFLLAELEVTVEAPLLGA